MIIIEWEITASEQFANVLFHERDRGSDVDGRHAITTLKSGRSSLSHFERGAIW